MYQSVRTTCQIIICLFVFFPSCRQKPLPNQEMIELLQQAEKYNNNPANIFAPEALIISCDSILNASSDPEVQMKALHAKAGAYLNLGQEQKAIDIYQHLITRIPRGYDDQRLSIMKDLALAYMRMGERMNCIQNHSAESCIFPISQAAVHMDKTGSEKAIELYKTILASDRNDLESR